MNHSWFFPCIVNVFPPRKMIIDAGRLSGGFSSGMDISKYLHTLSTQTLKKGAIIFTEGEDGKNTMFFLISGRVEIYADHKTAPRKVNEIKEGDFFGEIALIKNIPRTATAIVTSEDAVICRLDKQIFLTVARQMPEFLFDLLKTVIDRLIIAELKIKKLSGN